MTATTPPTSADILARIDELERKLDQALAGQRWTRELVTEMSPIARAMMDATTRRLDDWDRRGAFAMLRELGAGVEHVLAHFQPEDARRLAESLVAILDTVRNVTQPDVLELANDTTEVLHHPDDVRPMGLFGAARTTSRDPDVQRGLGVVVEMIRRIGRARGGASPPRAPETAVRRTNGQPASAGDAGASAPAPPPEAEVIRWEGHDFDARGFLIDPSTWTPELGEKIAAGLGITLDDEHRAVMAWVRADYASTGASPNVRRIAMGSGVGTEAMYRLFAPTPGKTCAMIAGVPKPVGCV